jgi:hypothetical protein
VGAGALMALAVFSVGEVSAHGLGNKPEFICRDGFAVEANFSVGPKQGECFTGLVQFVVGRKAVSRADENQEISRKSLRSSRRLKEGRVPVDMEKADLAGSLEYSLAHQWLPECRGQCCSASAHTFEFGGSISPRNWQSLWRPVFYAVIWPVPDDEREQASKNIDADSRCSSSVFEFVFNRNMPTQPRIPSLAVVGKRANETYIERNPRAVWRVWLVEQARLFQGVLSLKCPEQEQANYAPKCEPSERLLLPPYQAPIAQAIQTPAPIIGSHNSANAISLPRMASGHSFCLFS